MAILCFLAGNGKWCGNYLLDCDTVGIFDSVSHSQNIFGPKIAFYISPDENESGLYIINMCLYWDLFFHQGLDK